METLAVTSALEFNKEDDRTLWDGPDDTVDVTTLPLPDVMDCVTALELNTEADEIF